MVDKELVVPMLRVLLKLLVLFSDRPMLPVFMGRELQLVVLQLTLLPLLSLLPLRELRLPGLAHALLLGLVPVLVRTNRRLVVALVQVLVGDWLMLQKLVVRGLLLVDTDLRMLTLVLVLMLMCGTL
jgi:hypothetical protein